MYLVALVTSCCEQVEQMRSVASLLNPGQRHNSARPAIMVPALDGEDGMQHLDRWDAADEKRRSGELVEAEVTEANRGGLMVGLLGLRAFLPVSQVAPDAAADWRGLVGRRIQVELLEGNRRRNRV